jgi:hypothetical protein
VVAEDFLQDALVRQWLDGVEPAWTLQSATDCYSAWVWRSIGVQVGPQSTHSNALYRHIDISTN